MNNNICFAAIHRKFTLFEVCYNMAKAEANNTVTIDTLAGNIERLLKRKGKWDKLMSSFGVCQNDVQRMKTVMAVEELITTVRMQIIRRGSKSKAKAESFRLTGNKFFKCGNYEKALDFYSWAVLYAPFIYEGDIEKSDELALSFGNRFVCIVFIEVFSLKCDISL